MQNTKKGVSGDPANTVCKTFSVIHTSFSSKLSSMRQGWFPRPLREDTWLAERSKTWRGEEGGEGRGGEGRGGRGGEGRGGEGRGREGRGGEGRGGGSATEVEACL